MSLFGAESVDFDDFDNAVAALDDAAAVQFGVESIFGDVISNGIASLQSAINTAKAAMSNIATDYGAAVAALQTAGNTAVGVVGPGIDTLSSSDPKVMKVTQFAWGSNAKLAGVPSGPSTVPTDLQSAISIASDMARQYGDAYRLVTVSAARGGMGIKAPPTPKPAPVYTPPAYVAPTAAPAAALAAAPSTAITPPAAAPLAVPAPMDTTTVIAVGTGGFLGLLLGGAVGFRAGAQVGLFVGGPIGALFGAGAGWALTKALMPTAVPVAAK